MKDIINFLEELAANNDRAWFEANRDRYKAVKSRMDAVAKDFIEAVAAFDPSVEGVQVKDATYRIYRDTRFTKDKSPYKTWFGVYVCPRGKRSGFSGYYMHVEPENDYYMLCTGAYCPTPGEVKSIREEIMTEGENFVETIRAARGFEIDWTTAYKRMPQGWSADDPHSEYYRLRNYLLVKVVDRDYVLADDFISRAAAELSLTRPFNDTLNRAIEYAREMGW
ncbi:MAG: DUF2461 domain-containing protein [Alistipes sp.]|nr:DUF2461 domain-containing protein [Alistipes sp.]MBP3474280.1 DUF2461 domain-containing protein [Alistipes sp.]